MVLNILLYLRPLRFQVLLDGSLTVTSTIDLLTVAVSGLTQGDSSGVENISYQEPCTCASYQYQEKYHGLTFPSYSSWHSRVPRLCKILMSPLILKWNDPTYNDICITLHFQKKRLNEYCGSFRVNQKGLCFKPVSENVFNTH